jgi:hypothetical protein
MFAGISWSSFIFYTSVVLCLYYTGVIIIFYKHKISQIWIGKPSIHPTDKFNSALLPNSPIPTNGMGESRNYGDAYTDTAKQTPNFEEELKKNE